MNENYHTKDKTLKDKNDYFKIQENWEIQNPPF